MEEEDDVIEHLEKAEEKLEEIKEHNGDPGDPETSKNIQQAETMVTTLRKDKQLTLKKLVKLKQIVGYMSKKLELDQDEEVGTSAFYAFLSHVFSGDPGHFPATCTY